MDPEKLAGLSAVLAFLGTALWFVCRPVLVWLHRRFGREAFESEWATLAATAGHVEQMRTVDLPRIEAAATEGRDTARAALDGVNEIKDTLADIRQQLGQVQGAQSIQFPRDRKPEARRRAR